MLVTSPARLPGCQQARARLAGVRSSTLCAEHPYSALMSGRRASQPCGDATLMPGMSCRFQTYQPGRTWITSPGIVPPPEPTSCRSPLYRSPASARMLSELIPSQHSNSSVNAGMTSLPLQILLSLMCYSSDDGRPASAHQDTPSCCVRATWPSVTPVNPGPDGHASAFRQSSSSACRYRTGERTPGTGVSP